MDAYTVVSLTQHWFLKDGCYYRDAWVRTEDGSLKFVGIRDDLLESGQ